MSEGRNMPTPEQKYPGRRRFLQQAIAAGGAGVLLYLAGAERDGPSRSARTAAVTAPESQGYRLTGHIRAYYDSARS
jgi:hypothetical protein